MNEKLIADLFARFNENQLALGAAVEELALWVHGKGGHAQAENTRGALHALDRNLAAIKDGIDKLAEAGT